MTKNTAKNETSEYFCNENFQKQYSAVDVGNCSLNTNQARVPVIATMSANSIQASIFYTSNTFCKSVSNDQLITRTGTAGGAYSASVGALTINSSAGAITPSSSTDGTYTVTYHFTTPATGCTEADATTWLTNTSTPTTPVIRHAATPTTPISYCKIAGKITVIDKYNPSVSLISSAVR